MGRIKHLAKVREFFQKTPIINLNSLKKILGDSQDYVYLLINKMLEHGEIKRITRSYYSIYDDPTLAVFCFKPAYLGLQNALSIHNLWEQETNVVILTTKKVRTGIRSIFGNNVLIRRVTSKFFFGFEYIKYGDFYVPVSDIEKTFLDLIYFNQPLSRETLRNICNRVDRKKLEGYLRELDSNIYRKVKKMLK